MDYELQISDEELAKSIDKYSIYARVQPEHKVRIVKGWKAQDKITAMTGDGVNDVLALKEADCSIAMQSGSDAARNVSNMVLMDSNTYSIGLIFGCSPVSRANRLCPMSCSAITSRRIPSMESFLRGIVRFWAWYGQYVHPFTQWLDRYRGANITMRLP